MGGNNQIKGSPFIDTSDNKLCNVDISASEEAKTELVHSRPGEHRKNRIHKIGRTDMIYDDPRTVSKKRSNDCVQYQCEGS